jgi:hypothetical protein
MVSDPTPAPLCLHQTEASKSTNCVLWRIIRAKTSSIRPTKDGSPKARTACTTVSARTINDGYSIW